jgi:hypothetical protein
MNKKVVWTVVAIVVVLVIVGVAVWALGSDSGSNSGSNSTATASPTPGTGNSAGGQQAGSQVSLTQLFTEAKSQQCTFTNNEGANGVNTEGTIYLTSGEMRGDFISSSGNGTTQSHMITDGTTAYFWTDSPAQGVQMSFANMTSAAAQSHESVNPAQPSTYICTSWTPDNSEFVIPTTIKFTDIDSMLNASGSASMGGGASMCASMCANAGNATEVAQCKQAMGC